MFIYKQTKGQHTVLMVNIMARQFTIIKNSESNTGYDIPDKEFKGYKSNLLCGWQYEFKNADGKFNYGSVIYSHTTPEDEAYRWGEENAFTVERWKGWEPTGRVVFRGYAEEFYDAEDRDWYVKQVEV